MRNKTITLLAIALSVLSLNLTAQTNLNFETWSSGDPTGWETSNFLTLRNGGVATVLQNTTAPAEGSASVKLVTGSCPACPSYAMNTPFGDFPMPFPNPLGGVIVTGAFTAPGVPYTQRPLSVSFSFKAKPKPNDGGVFTVQLTRWNPNHNESETVGEAAFVMQSEVQDWTTVTIPIVYNTVATPDTIVIGAMSSMGSIPDMSGFGIPRPPVPAPVTGSELELDNIILNLPSCEGLSLTVSGTNVTGAHVTDGTATATVFGGTAPYTYLWSNGETTQTISNLAIGNYRVTITDANGCQKAGSHYVAPAGCNLSLSITGTPSTSDSPFTGTGSATVSVVGGQPCTFQWSNGATTATITNLAFGTYSVVAVSNADNTCMAWGFYTVYGPNSSSFETLATEDAATIQLYPNPSNGVFAVESGNLISNIEVVNLLGEKVYTQQNVNAHKAEVDLRHKPKGMYVLSLHSNGQSLPVRKLVVVK